MEKVIIGDVALDYIWEILHCDSGKWLEQVERAAVCISIKRSLLHLMGKILALSVRSVM